MPKKETSTKVETVIALASRKSGVTLDEIAERLNCEQGRCCIADRGCEAEGGDGAVRS